MNTAISQLMKDLVQNGMQVDFAKYLQMERNQIQNAVIHGLEQFAHAEDWKIYIAQNYYNEKHLGIEGLPGEDK
jgi:hypothetical protein